MSNKTVPYKTPSGVAIGKNYSPVKRREFSRDEERIQKLFIGNPLDDGLENLGRMALISVACIVALISLTLWVTI